METNFTALSDPDVWDGARLDTDARKTINALCQAKAYCRSMSEIFKPKTKQNSNCYGFGNDIQNLLGSIKIRGPITKCMVHAGKVNVARSDVIFLIGLHFQDKYQMIVNNVDTILHCPSFHCELRLLRKRGHMYREWMPQDRILYQYSELLKLHRNFSHPDVNKLLNF